jgi:hypothetical protein
VARVEKRSAQRRTDPYPAPARVAVVTVPGPMNAAATNQPGPDPVERRVFAGGFIEELSGMSTFGPT